MFFLGLFEKTNMHFYNKQKTLTGKGNKTDKLNMQNKWRETKDTEDEVNNNTN